jgi:hypothetical protein
LGGLVDQFRGAYQQGLLAEPMFSGSTGSGSSALMRSLLGQGEYADSGMILPFAKTPSGENIFSFPAPIQAIARTSARAMGGMPLDIDLYTGLPAENVLADAAEAAGAFTGAGLLTPKPAGAIGMSGGGSGVTRVIPPRDIDDLGFYSQALEAASLLPQAKGTGQQMEKMLINAGVKPDEIAFTPGLRGLLDRPQVTREEVVGLLQENRIRPQETVLEGGDPEFEGMNFPAQAEQLDPYEAYGRSYVDDRVSDMIGDDYYADYVVNAAKEAGMENFDLQAMRKAVAEDDFAFLGPDEDNFARDTLEQLVFEEYSYDPVLRLQDPDTGYEIVGSDEMGYTIRDAGGNSIDPRGNDIPYSLGEARIQAENHAMDAGLVGYGGGETRFSEHTEPSGTNYREILLQVPEYEGMRGEFVQRGHFDEPNIAVHARTKDRNTESGSNDVLYVEELQSDWAQQGRDKGFATKESVDKKQKLEATITPLMDEQMRLSKERDKLIEDYGAKIADKEAAKSPLNDEGMYYSRFGSVYRLEPDESSVLVLPRSQVEELLQLGMDQAYPFRPGKETDWEIEAGTKYNGLSSKIKDLSSQIKPIKDELSGLPSGPQKGPLVGNTEKFAEAGIKRLLIQAANEGKKYVSFSQGDLQADRWNNPGLEVYYDKIIPNVAKKVAKRFDKDAFAGSKYIEDLGDRFTIEITPKMREAIQEGVPLFVSGGQGLLAAGEQMRQDRVQPKGIMF